MVGIDINHGEQSSASNVKDDPSLVKEYEMIIEVK